MSLPPPLALSPSTTTHGTAAAAAAASLRRPVQLVAGLALLATPVLIIGGILTSPPQESRSTADYIESLARDPWLSSVSATLLHYGWIALAFGLVVATGLVRGRRGRLLTLLGGVLGGFSAVQMSGLMLNDYFLVALGNHLSSAEAVGVADAMMVQGDVLSTLWWQSAKVAILLPVLLYAGLARAGVIPWWSVPLSLFPMVAPYVVMGLVSGADDQVVGVSTLGLVAGAIVGLLCYLPTVVVGLRLISRARLVDAVTPGA